jgi:poly(3-hydroxybutyrate) depolymerase/sugar lactone lactonase YvrE
MGRGSALYVSAALAVLLFGTVPGPAAAQGVTLKVTVDGVERTALVYPGTQATTAASPLVFVFHYGTGTASNMASLTQFSHAWPEATLVYPQGLPLTNSLGGSGLGWQTLPGETDDRDVRFVDLLLKAIGAAYKVDERRVYATGWSSGAFMTYLLLTMRPDRFAAFAPVSGFPLPSLKWARVPRPVLITHGKNDRMIPISAAEWARNQLQRLNGCGGEAAAWAPGALLYQPCASGQAVIWSVHDGGHEWPSGATANIVRFFKAQALPAPSAAPGPPADLDTRRSVAGNGRAGFAGDRGSATAAQLFFPEGVALDSAGNLFIADTGNNRVRKVAPDGTITTMAQLDFPEGVAVDRAGGLFVSNDDNYLVGKIIRPATIKPVALREPWASPSGLAADGAGNLFIADTENHRVRKVAPDGTLATVAGTGTAGYSGDGGAATGAQLNAPWGLAVDGEGNLFIADSGNHRVRKVASDGTITIVAGTGTPGFAGDEGPATAAQLNQPLGLAVDSQGNLFIADSHNQRIRRVGPDGVITTVFGAGSGSGGSTPNEAGYYPSGIAVDRAGNLLIADPINHRVWKVPGVAAPGLLAGQPFPNP